MTDEIRIDHCVILVPRSITELNQAIALWRGRFMLLEEELNQSVVQDVGKISQCVHMNAYIESLSAMRNAMFTSFCEVSVRRLKWNQQQS